MKKLYLFIVLQIASFHICGQTFPTAKEVASKMTIGWNIGNTLESTWGDASGETVVNQRLIDSVKAAGFNAIRIPVAWDFHSTNGTIDAAWIARIKQVVDYCIGRQMYVIINIHWDKGWLENNCTVAMQASVNVKQKSYWTQIANYFKSYDEHLLFASANEPNVDDATQMGVLLSYHQTFVDAVRATGGNNAQRILIVQGPGTDTEKTSSLMNTMPTDIVSGRMMAEVHYYTPYQYCLMTADATWGKMFYYWGSCFHSATDAARNPTWGEEAFLDAQFQNMKTKFVDKGIPVIIGEFGVNKRTGLTGANLALHLASRQYYLRYITTAARKSGLILFYWDPGFQGDNSTTLFERSNGTVTDRDAINAIMAGTYGTQTTMGCNANDCKGVYNGNAYLNDKGECVLGKSVPVSVPDCSGVSGGTATTDACGRCTGGTTGLVACTPVKKQAEDICQFDGTVDTDNAGFEGTGYVDSPNEINAKLTLYLQAPAAGDIWFSTVYANGGAADRPAKLVVNGVAAASAFPLPATGGWTSYKSASTSLSLAKGTNKVELFSTVSDGLPNIDYFQLFGNAVFGTCPSPAVIQLREGWNLVGYPNVQSSAVDKALSSIWANVVSVKNIESFYSKQVSPALNTLTTLSWGEGYYINVDKACTLVWNIE